MNSQKNINSSLYKMQRWVIITLFGRSVVRLIYGSDRSFGLDLVIAYLLLFIGIQL